jgi:hypothetical protein
VEEAFDPYRKWLGIPPEEQPPNHYRLLGIALFEDDPDVSDGQTSAAFAGAAQRAFGGEGLPARSGEEKGL